MNIERLAEQNQVMPLYPEPFDENKPNLCVSFSGGRSSAVMTRLILQRWRDSHNIVVTFANTGCEHEATLQFVHDCDLNWGFQTVWLEAVVSQEPGVGVRHKVVDFTSASRNGEPFEAMIRKYGIPNPTSPQCTSRLKIEVMESFLRSLGWRLGKRCNYKAAIGIRADEIDRIKAEDRFVYPLIDWGLTKPQVNSMLAEIPWDLRLPSDAYGNCTWCWKKSDRKLFTLARQAPSVFEFPRRIEERYSHHKADSAAGNGKGERFFFRRHRSTTDILRQAKESKFVPYQDETQFTFWDDELDLGGACDQGCEAF